MDATLSSGQCPRQKGAWLDSSSENGLLKMPGRTNDIKLTLLLRITDMPERWLQIKGDPALRAQLFQQHRIERLFDTDIDRVHDIVHVLLTRKGVFHTTIHYSSSQLTCWFARDPFCYEKFIREEVLADGFIERFQTQTTQVASL